MNAKKFKVGDVVKIKEGNSPYFDNCEGIVVGRDDRVALPVYVKIIKDKTGIAFQEADFRDRELEKVAE